MDAPLNLTPDGFKELHNGLSKLRSLRKELEPILNSDLTGRFDEAFRLIDAALVDAYTLDHSISMAKMKFYDEVRTRHHFVSEWSINKVEVDGFWNNFATGTVKVKYGSWDPIILENPTWLQIWRTADYLIRSSGDLHHIFIEDFVLKGDTYELVTGS